MDTKQKFRRKSAGFESLERQQKKKKAKRSVFYAVLIVTFTLTFFALWFSVFFKVQDIEISGNSRYSAAEIIEAVGIETGDNLYAANEDDLKTLLTEKLPYICGVSVSRRLPSTLIITVEEEQAVMYSELYGDNYLITEGLTVLERVGDIDTDGLVKVTAGEIKRCYAGEELVYTDGRMSSVIIQLYSALSSYGLIDRIDSFSIKNRFDISVSYDGRIDVYFGSIDNIDVKVRFLIGILEHLYDDDSGRLDISNIKEASFFRYSA